MPEKDNTVGGSSRRSFIKKSVVGGTLGFAITKEGVDQFVGSAKAENFFTDNMETSDTIHSSGDIYDWKCSHSSGINYYDCLTSDTSDRVELVLRDSSQAVSNERKKNGDWNRDAQIGYGEVELYWRSGSGSVLTYIDGSVDHIGVDPRVRSQTYDPVYDDAAEVAVREALAAAAGPEFEVANSAASVIDAFVNDVVNDSGDGKESGSSTKYKWDWSDNHSEVSFHKKFAMRGTV